MPRPTAKRPCGSKLTQRTQSGKLVKAKAYTLPPRRATGPGPKLGGVSKRLHDHVFRADAHLPIGTDAKPGGAFRGPSGGLRRGTMVDSQVSALASRRRAQGGRDDALSKAAFAALETLNMTPAIGQRVVLDPARGVATAADLIATRPLEGQPGQFEVVIVELKTGYGGNRLAAATDKRGRVVKMHAPCRTAKDCVLHRHLAQLAATYALFKQEKGTLKALHSRRDKGQRRAPLREREPRAGVLLAAGLVERREQAARRGGVGAESVAAVAVVGSYKPNAQPSDQTNTQTPRSQPRALKGAQHPRRPPRRPLRTRRARTAASVDDGSERVRTGRAASHL